MKLEICIDSYESILNAKNAGADRLEICSALDLDGLTPTVGLVDLAATIEDIEKFVMLRPRKGDFHYDDLDFATIKQDILVLKERNIDGFVFGALKADGSLDLAMIKEVVDLAFPKKVVLHRAFDYSKGGEHQIKDLIDIGIVRILTSGKKEKATDGLALIAELQKVYGDKIEIMAGSGVNPSNIAEIYEKTGINNFHMSARSVKESNLDFAPDFGYANDEIRVASFDMVKEAVEVIEGLK